MHPLEMVGLSRFVLQQMNFLEVGVPFLGVPKVRKLAFEGLRGRSQMFRKSHVRVGYEVEETLNRQGAYRGISDYTRRGRV